jgi:hypothetical protein
MVYYYFAAESYFQPDRIIPIYRCCGTVNCVGTDFLLVLSLGDSIMFTLLCDMCLVMHVVVSIH